MPVAENQAVQYTRHFLFSDTGPAVNPSGSTTSKLNMQQAWSMAVGGMIGGGIFSTLGVVVAIAGSLAWILIVGYVLTNAVYAFTFGQYLGHVVGFGAWFDRYAAVAIMLVFVGINLRSVGEAGWVEVLLVWLKLVVLISLAGWGIYQWNPQGISQGMPDAGLIAALFGGASVFMAYEGFQLLAYDYDDIREPDKTMPKAVLLAILLVIAVYILVALGTAMLIGADQVVEHQEIALAIAGEKAWGTVGVIIVTLAAVASTGSAINSTLFATARLGFRRSSWHLL